MVRTWKPPAAGILSIIAGTAFTLTGLFVIAGGDFIRQVLWHWEFERAGMGILAFILGLAAVTGGVFAIRRQRWGLALAGAICAALPQFISVVGTLATPIMGIMAIIFLALSRNEFNSGAPQAGTG